MGRFTDSQLMSLTRDEAFQAWVATDPELDRLCSVPRRGPDDILQEIGLAFGGCAAIGPGMYLDAPTAGALLILGAVRSPYLIAGERRLLDVDVAAWVLSMGRHVLDADSLTVAGIEAAAAGFLDGADRTEADRVICGLISEAFRALDLVPHGPGGKPCLFDLHWYAGLVSSVAPLAGVSAERVGWDMPLTLVMHYVVAERRRQGGHIIDQTPKELIMARVNQMCAEWCAKKGYT